MDCSYEVRGVSEAASCAGSERECLLVDEVSVLLLLSTSVRLEDFACGGRPWTCTEALPVISRFLKACTSIEARGIALSSLS